MHGMDDFKIILLFVLKKEDVWVWTGFIWCRVSTSCRLLWQWTMWLCVIFWCAV